MNPSILIPIIDFPLWIILYAEIIRERNSYMLDGKKHKKYFVIVKHKGKNYIDYTSSGKYRKGMEEYL